jgi:twitching motility protein PilT
MRGAERLQAGKATLTADELEQWLEVALARERWLAFELGQEVSESVDLDGERVQLRARHAGGVVQVTVIFDVVAATEAAEIANATPPLPKEKEVAAEPKETVAAAPKESVVAEPKEAAVAARVSERPLDRLLARLVDLGGSDLHLTATCLPMLRLHGDMRPFPGATVPLSSEHILLMCEEIASAANRREFRETSDTDFAYELAGVARFRVNLFRDRRGAGAVFRQIPSEIRSLDELGVPTCAKSLCMLSKGLVLVTGPTGSGKSTTLAAAVDYVNEHRADHIITIEDPIEFVHANKGCLVHQREVGSHTESFKRALRAALREDPDIILVGELRDLETMAIAIETAETGHLVFGTLHTTTAVSTVDRLIDQFPPDRQDQIRVMLSESLKGVVSQILLKRVGGGRVAAFEVLLGVPAVANLIREGKTFQLPTVIQTSKRMGMKLLNDSLAELVRAGAVELDEAMDKSSDKDALRSLLRVGREGESAGFDRNSGKG